MSEETSVGKKEVLARMMSICSRAEKCKHDIQLKLDQYPLNEAEKEWITTRLMEEKFIDNKRYAGFFVKDKFRLNQWGRLKIRQALYMKKIDEETIREALQSIDDSEYEELLLKLIRSKNKELKDNDPYLKKGKLFRFAAQKGFEPQLIYNAIDKIFKGHDS